MEHQYQKEIKENILLKLNMYYNPRTSLWIFLIKNVVILVNLIFKQIFQMIIGRSVVVESPYAQQICWDFGVILIVGFDNLGN